jgi:hypothetical protein
MSCTHPAVEPGVPDIYNIGRSFMELLWLLEFGVHKHSDSGKSIQIPEAG